jgi:hypothetical protein
MASTWKAAAVLAVLSAQGGCTYDDPIEGSDRSVFFPTGRVTVPIIREGERTLFGPASAWEWHATANGEEGGAATQAQGKAIRPALGLEIDYAYAHGRSSQGLGAGETARLDRIPIEGPARVRHRYDFHLGTLGARGGIWIRDALGVELLLGGGVSSMDLEVESAGRGERDGVTTPGTFLGGQVSVRPVRPFTIYARGTWTGVPLALTFLRKNNTAGIETGGELTPRPGVGLLGGWKWWIFEDRDGFGSDIDLSFSGPFAGVHLTF